MIKWLMQVKELILNVADELCSSIGYAASSQAVQYFKSTSVNIFVSVFLPVAKIIVEEVDDLVLSNNKKKREAFNRITKAVEKARRGWRPHLVNLLIEMAVAELKARRHNG